VSCSCKILREATPKSLVILDGRIVPSFMAFETDRITELGRGTSTYVRCNKLPKSRPLIFVHRTAWRLLE
jgi:hypothetical protein